MGALFVFSLLTIEQSDKLCLYTFSITHNFKTLIEIISNNNKKLENLDKRFFFSINLSSTHIHMWTNTHTYMLTEQITPVDNNRSFFLLDCVWLKFGSVLVCVYWLYREYQTLHE